MAGNEPKKGGPGVPVDVAALRAAREAKGWSQKALAKAMGCDARVIERIESRGTAALQSLADIAEALGVDSRSLRPSAPAPAPPQPVNGRLFQLPTVVADFTGRGHEIDTMTALLRGQKGRVAVSAVRGMGGVGKTSLAVKVAHAVRDHFPDAQLLVELRGTGDAPMTACEAMARVIRDFHPETAKLPDAAADLLPLYRGVLAGKRVLVVLDNARDEEQVKLLVTAPPPAGFIVTSRAALALDGVDSIPLDVLPRPEALELLRTIVGAKPTDDDLRAVAELCGRLPLALRVAGDFLRLHPNWTPPRYIDALKDEGRRLEKLRGKTKEKDVEAVLGLSAAELVKSNPEQAARWQALSVFPADFAPDAAATVWELPAADAVDELTDLLDRSLIQYDEQTTRYSLHDLMRPIARAAFEYADAHPLHATAEERLRAAERRFVKHYHDVLEACDTLYECGHDNVLAAMKLFDLEFSNIEAGWAWASANREPDRFAAEMCRDYPGRGAYVVYLRLNVRTRIVWQEQAVEACRTLGDRLGEGKALGNLGGAHRVLGNARAAIAFYEQSLAIAREIGDRRGEGNALGNLGNAHTNLGDARTAITFHEQHLAVAREIGDRRGEGNALGNLGNAHDHLGDTHAAIVFYEQVMAVASEMGDLHSEANANWNMAEALRDLGRHREAIPFAERSLAFFEAIGHACVEEDRQELARWRAEAAGGGGG